MTFGSARPVSASQATIAAPPTSADRPSNRPLFTRCSSVGVGDVRVLHRCLGIDARGRHDPSDGQSELRGEGEVALVVGGHGHDRAGAVPGQDVVGDEDRDPLAVDRVDRLRADGHAGLLAVG